MCVRVCLCACVFACVCVSERDCHMVIMYTKMWLRLRRGELLEVC